LLKRRFAVRCGYRNLAGPIVEEVHPDRFSELAKGLDPTSRLIGITIIEFVTRIKWHSLQQHVY
jgi:hypothetical protein